jgi:predicted dehydrogenase
LNDSDQYGVGAVRKSQTIPAPNLPYLPRDPKEYNPGIGLIGCGGIAENHLREYQKAGYRVVALCDVVEERALKRRDEFFPQASIYADYRAVLDREDVGVVDIATHPIERAPMLIDALNAGKHVLSQKPFVLDLDFGETVIALAREKKRKLAVNQNGRWAPHFSYIRQAIAHGLLGEVHSAHFTVHWDHGWTAGTAFNQVKHLMLYDFAIHWFDIVTCFMVGKTPRRVFASIAKTTTQRPDPPMLAQALIDFEDAQAAMLFNGDVGFDPRDRTYVSGSKGTAVSEGVDLLHQDVTLTTKAGSAQPDLEGDWFSNGFHGTMGELLCAIEEDREPENNAEGNLASLALCFAAVQSAETGTPQTPGDIRKLGG